MREPGSRIPIGWGIYLITDVGCGLIVGYNVPLRRPRTRWKNVAEKYSIMIRRNVRLEDAYDRDRWNEIVVAGDDGSTLSAKSC